MVKTGASTNGTVTDTEGKFRFDNVPLGRFDLEVSYLGYQTLTVELDLSGSGSVQQNFALDASVVEGEVVVVTAQAQGQLAAINQQLASDKIANIVSEQRIQELPDFNAAAALSRLPGVSTVESSGEANKVVIRGLQRIRPGLPLAPQEEALPPFERDDGLPDGFERLPRERWPGQAKDEGQPR